MPKTATAMLAKLLFSVSIAIDNVRANPMHTFLSILGVIIGVGALVAILSLGDGLEKYARDQISSTTDLNSIIIRPQTSEVVDGIRMPIEDHPKVKLEHAHALQQKFEGRAFITINKQRSVRAGLAGDTLEVPAVLVGTTDLNLTGLDAELSHGRFLSKEDLDQGAPTIILNELLAAKLCDDVGSLIGKEVSLLDKNYEVVGIKKMKGAGGISRGFVVFTAFPDREAEPQPLMLEVRSNEVEKVGAYKEETEAWLDENFASGSEGFSVVTNSFRVEQARQGVLLFKIVMGMITGIAVVVGGIGIMNVLLISVSERTKEIGIRKATGAKKRDILFQFLAESITISGLGSFLGLLFGLASVFALFPIVQSLADVPFEPAFTYSTLIVISIIAVLIGVVFGTYPAWKAAKLLPIDAIRRE